MAISLEILIVEGQEPITAALASALGKRGHRVATARTVETALSLPTPDVFVCEARLSGACGFDLLAAITERGERARSVLLLSEPTVEDCLRAVRLGAGALLTKPFRLSDLVHAVEAEEAGGRAALPRPTKSRPVGTDGGFDMAFPPVPESTERCARELAAFCVRRGVPSSARARIAGAACEIVDNAIRHGRLDRDIRVRARFEGNWLHLRIEDGGVGFDAGSAGTVLPLGPALTGLARAKALSDGFGLATSAGEGTRVDLSFCATPATFSDEAGDLSEADFLPPPVARQVLLALLEGETPEVTGVSPAIAVVLGRLLAGPDPFDLTPERAAGLDRLP